MKSMIPALIHLYRHLISPLLPANTCRFYPTCSQYALDAFERYQTLKAVRLTVRRILRCHPLHPGGYDPVP